MAHGAPCGESTVLRSAPYIDGGEILTALDQAYGCSDSCHCSACAEFKTRQSAIPRAPTHEYGYILVEGLAFKSQSLLCLGKIFNDLGRSPVSVVVDGAGELNSKHADLFYANRRTTKDATAAGQQWMNSRVERRHAVINQMTAASLRHAGAVTAFCWFCLQHMVFICNLLLLARDPKTRKAWNMTVWELISVFARICVIILLRRGVACATLS